MIRSVAIIMLLGTFTSYTGLNSGLESKFIEAGLDLHESQLKEKVYYWWFKVKKSKISWKMLNFLQMLMYWQNVRIKQKKHNGKWKKQQQKVWFLGILFDSLGASVC